MRRSTLRDIKRILLVEDSPETRDIYASLLAHEGYQVLLAESGEEGVAMALQHRPDLILLNVGIPEVDGWTCTRLLKADPATRAIPLIVITAYTTPDDQRRAEEVGSNGYLDKPCPPTRLVEEVRRWIGEANGGRRLAWRGIEPPAAQ
jgi:two-component system, cell cycle response regulator DivK